jgi:hypothetical protein
MHDCIIITPVSKEMPLLSKHIIAHLYQRKCFWLNKEEPRHNCVTTISAAEEMPTLEGK